MRKCKMQRAEFRKHAEFIVASTQSSANQIIKQMNEKKAFGR